jgi:protein-disulfide isomerase
MTGNRRNRNRRGNLRTKQKKQTRNFYIGIGVVVLVAVVVGLYLYLNQPPEVAAGRLGLEAYIGAETAKVTVFEFGAYGCHACRATHQSGFNQRLEALIARPEYADKVRFVFVNFPVISPLNDPISPEAAQCTLDQGQEAFWAFHNALFDISDAEYAQMRREADFVSFAGQIETDVIIDTVALAECLSNDTHVRTVQYHERRARERFVQGTPTFFVNDREVFRDLDEIERFIRAEL